MPSELGLGQRRFNRIYVGMSMATTSKPLRVLMISSCGGHWVQMNRVAHVFKAENLAFASTEGSYSQVNPNYPFFCIPDASRTSGVLTLIRQALTVLWIILRFRPRIVITTGASVGFFALVFAKCLRAKTIWLDSIANIDQVSMSGAKASKFADLYLTQWEHLAKEGGPEYFGTVI